MNEHSNKPYVEYEINGEKITYLLKRGANIIGSSPKADIAITNPLVRGIYGNIIFWPKNLGNYCTIVSINRRTPIFVNKIPTPENEGAIWDPSFLSNGDVITFGNRHHLSKLIFIDGEQEKLQQKPPNPYLSNQDINSYIRQTSDLPSENFKEFKKDLKQSIRRNIDPETLSAKKSEFNVELNISSKDSDSDFKLDIPIDKLLYLIHRSPIFHNNDLGINIDSRIYEVAVNGKLVDPPLTKLEFNVLSYMYSRNGEVCTKYDFANNISGWKERTMNNSEEDPVGDPEIYQVISRIRRKIGRDYIKTVSGRGYRLIDEHNLKK